MSRFHRLTTMICLCWFGLVAGNVQAAELDHVPGQVMVFVTEGVGLNDLAVDKADDLDADLGRTLREHGLSARRYIANPLDRKSGLASRFMLLTSQRADFDPVVAARSLAASPLIVSAAPNYLRRVFVLPDDPAFGRQWYLQPGNNPAIDMPAAWDLQPGCTEAVIAIMDTGVDHGHPDLADNMWRNPGEVPGNGVDDDGNGYIDDVYGWDFGQGDNDPRPHYTPDALGIDVGFHGTHCAGIASAATDNGVGVAGAGWQCRLMALKLPNSAGEMTDVAITGSFLYAIAEGVDVISMSFGGPDQDGMAAFMQDLVDQALAANVTCVASAGNSDNSDRMYPAACTGVISVGATDETNGRASFSSYGDWVKIAAPGNRIWSTISDNYAFGFLDQLLYMLSFEWDGTTPYMYSDGTSMSAPLVAGVCGLIRCRAPGMTPNAVLAHLEATGDVVAFDQPLGVKLNVYEAIVQLQYVPVPDAVGLDDLALLSYPNPFNPTTTIRYTLPSAGRVAVRIYDHAGRLIRTLQDAPRAGGPQSLIWNGRDEAGRTVASGLYLVQVRTPQATASAKLVMLK